MSDMKYVNDKSVMDDEMKMKWLMKMDRGCFEFHTMQINMSIFSLSASMRAVVITSKSLPHLIYWLTV